MEDFPEAFCYPCSRISVNSSRILSLPELSALFLVDSSCYIIMLVISSDHLFVLAAQNHESTPYSSTFNSKSHIHWRTCKYFLRGLFFSSVVYLPFSLESTISPTSYLSLSASFASSHLPFFLGWTVFLLGGTFGSSAKNFYSKLSSSKISTIDNIAAWTQFLSI